MRLFKSESELGIASSVEVTEVMRDHARWIPMMTSPQADMPYCIGEITLNEVRYRGVYQFHDYGNANLVYVCSEIGMVLKIPIPEDTQSDVLRPLSDSDIPNNVIAIWNKIYPDFNTELVSIDGYSAWIMPYFDSESEIPGVEDVCAELQRIYQNFNLMILDAHLLRNFAKADGRTICIDIGAAREITENDDNLFMDENELDNSQPNILTMQQAILCLSYYQIDFNRFPRINISDPAHWNAIKKLAKAYLDQDDSLTVEKIVTFFTPYHALPTFFSSVNYTALPDKSVEKAAATLPPPFNILSTELC